MHRPYSISIILIAVIGNLLALRPVHADFGAGTITFDETNYTVCDSDGSVYSGIGATENASTNTFFQSSGGLSRVESGGSLSHYTVTMQDGAVVPKMLTSRVGIFTFDLPSINKQAGLQATVRWMRMTDTQ